MTRPPAGARHPTSREMLEWRDAYLLVAPALLFFLAFVIYPLFSTVYLSAFDYSLTGGSLRFVGAANFAELLEDESSGVRCATTAPSWLFRSSFNAGWA